MKPAFVAGVAVRGPGLSGWAQSRPVLAGETEYVNADTNIPQSALLSGAERRRTGPLVRLALAVAEEAASAASLAPDSLRLVFGNASGDGQTIHALLEALTSPGQDVSPTQFHNSVHNAPAGYWSIATRSLRGATCLGCDDATAPASLLAAMAEVTVQAASVLLCLYDVPLPAPLDTRRPIAAPFGAALVLTPTATPATLASLNVEYVPQPADASPCPVREMQPLQDGIPAARLLPILGLLARGVAGRVRMPYLDGGCLEVTLDTCPSRPDA